MATSGEVRMGFHGFVCPECGCVDTCDVDLDDLRIICWSDARRTVADARSSMQTSRLRPGRTRFPGLMGLRLFQRSRL